MAANVVENSVPCPFCEGKGSNFGISCGPRQSRMGHRTCTDCGGSGRISPEHLQRYKDGNAMWEERVHGRGITQREEAARLGCSVQEWSRIEHGREPETDAGREALVKRRQELGL